MTDSGVGTSMSTNGTRRPGSRTDTGQTLRAVVERYDDAPNQCTLYPEESDKHERMATWITAQEPAFVDLAVVR